MFFTWNTAWPMPERTGAEAGDRAPRTERLVGDRRAPERLQPVAARVGEADQPAHAALVGQRRRLAPHRDGVRLQPRRQRIERRRVRHLEAEIALAIGERAIDDQPLLAVVHAERAAGVATLDHLHAEPVGGEVRPVGQIGRPAPT